MCIIFEALKSNTIFIPSAKSATFWSYIISGQYLQGNTQETPYPQNGFEGFPEYSYCFSLLGIHLRNNENY